MKVLLITVWNRKGGIVTHVKNIIKNSKQSFDIISYPKVKILNIPIIRAFSFIIFGIIKGLKKEYSIIHAHYLIPQGLLGLILKKLKKKPLVVTLHGSDLSFFSMPVLSHISKAILRNADYVLLVGSWMKDYVNGKCLRYRVVFNAVEPREIKRKKKNAVVYVGALIKKKNVHKLIECFKIVENKINAELLIVGNGSYRKNLEKISKKLRIKNIVFTGYVEDPYEYIAESKVLVLPSKKEGFGIVFLEAMLCNTVPIAMDRSDAVVDGYNGILAKNTDELGDAIVKVINNDIYRLKLVKNGKKVLKRFNVEGFAERIEKIYKEVEKG